MPLATARGRLAQESALGPGSPTPIAGYNDHDFGLGSGCGAGIGAPGEGLSSAASTAPLDGAGIGSGGGTGTLAHQQVDHAHGLPWFCDALLKVAAAGFLISYHAKLGGTSAVLATNRGFDAIMSSELPPEQKTQAYCIMAKAVSLLADVP